MRRAPIQIRTMRWEEIPFADSLRQMAGWNQLPADWEWSPHANKHPAPPAIEKPVVLNDGELNAITRLEQDSFGVSRGLLLREIARQSYACVTSCCQMESPAGFGFIRPGANALQIGPVVAESVEAFHRVIQTLTQDFLTQRTYRIYWDIPDQNLAAVNWAQQKGFKIQRKLTRMYLGSNPTIGKPDRCFAVASPDLG